MMIGNEYSAFFRSTRGALSFLQPPIHQHCRDRTPAPHIRTRIEWGDQNIADQSLGADLSTQRGPTHRIRSQLDVVIPKPLEGLTYAPPFSKFHKHEPNGFANPLIGMQDNFTREIPDIADRQPLKQLTAARFRFLPCLHPL